MLRQVLSNRRSIVLDVTLCSSRSTACKLKLASLSSFVSRFYSNNNNNNNNTNGTATRVKEVKLVEYGNDPSTSLRLFQEEMETAFQQSNGNGNGDGNELDTLVELIAAPINPADINMMQGRYAILPAQLPATLGNEGLFRVTHVKEENGTTGQKLNVGDWVLPAQTQSGTGNNKLTFSTWRSKALVSSTDLIKLPDSVLDEKNTMKMAHTCATLAVNPTTALRLLSDDFQTLKPDDTLIQNGANSAVGQAVIQLARARQINVINIVRKRDSKKEQDELDDYLRNYLGAKHIYTEQDLRTNKELNETLWTEMPRPRLALNCVGGRATTDMVRLLDKEAMLVTYGGMSKKPVTINTADFIFKNLKCAGFWLTAWKRENPKEYRESIAQLAELAARGEWRPPKCIEFSLDKFDQAVQHAQRPTSQNTKTLLIP